MQVERNPPVPMPWLAGPLTWLVRQVLRRPQLVVGVAVILALVSVYGSVRWLGFRTNRLDLLNPASEYHQRWLRYLDGFGAEDDLVVVLECASPDEHARLASDVAAVLASDPERFTAIVHERNFDSIRRKALHQLGLADLRQIRRAVGPCAAWAAGDWTSTQPEFLPMQLAARLTSARQVAPVGHTESTGGSDLSHAITRWAAQVEAVAAGRPRTAPREPGFDELIERFDQLRPQPVLVAGGQYALVVLRLTPAHAVDPPTRSAAIAELRKRLDQVAQRHATARIGLTGMAVLEDDEMCASQVDMTWASLISFAGVVLLLQLGFRRWRHTLLAVVVLVIGMSWSFGWITLTIGHLNLLSVSFAAILIGLGIDFGIHFLTCYLELANLGVRPRAALLRTAGQLGPGIVTGAVTTAVAFFAAAHSEFTGVAELGLIAGVGVLLCLLSALVVLPPMILIVDRRRAKHEPLAAPRCGDWLAWCYEHPTVLLVFLMLAGVAACGFGGLHYDHNLLNLQSDGLASVEWERRLTDHADHSVWFAVSIADDLDELHRRKAAFLKLPTVARVEEISSLVPEPDHERQALVTDIHQVLAKLPAEVPILPAPDADRLRQEIAQLLATLDALPFSPPELTPVRAALVRLAAALEPIPSGELSLRLAAWRQDSVERQLEQLRHVRELADTKPPTWDDLPPELAGRFRGRHGEHLLRIYARDDVWDIEPLGRFVEDLEFVDPRVTGHPVQTFYASQQVQTSYLHSGVYACLCVLIVVYLDFRHLGHACLAMAPLALCFLLTFGLAGWLRLPLNAANLLALPLLLGIGIDNGVHVVHQWRQQTGPYRLSNAVALSILLCSSTTMAGFGGLMFARHQGLQSMGQLLCLGMAIGLATSLVFLPATLKLYERRVPGRR